MTPVFSPYAGRATRVLAKPGDGVKPTSPLLELYTPDLIQAQSDLIGNATSPLVKAQNALSLARLGTGYWEKPGQTLGPLSSALAS